MKNHEGGAITTELPRGGFEAAQGIVSGLGNAYQASNGPEAERLGLNQDFVLQQVASEGILHILADMNVDGAVALTTDLKVKIDADPYTDMVAVALSARSSLDQLDFEMKKHRQALAEAEEQDDEEAQTHESTILQLEEQMVLQQRYVRLADAVGATARATVAVLTGSNQEAARASLGRERKIVEAAAEPMQIAGMIRAGTAIGSVPGYALSSMLDKLESPPLAQLG